MVVIHVAGGELPVDRLVSLTEARKRLHELVRDLEEARVVLLRHGRPVAMMVSSDEYDALRSRIEDLQDKLSVFEAAAEGPDMVVPWEKVKGPFPSQ
jgi:prevent-host-death family protein